MINEILNYFKFGMNENFNTQNVFIYNVKNNLQTLIID